MLRLLMEGAFAKLILKLDELREPFNPGRSVAPHVQLQDLCAAYALLPAGREGCGDN